MTTEFDIQWIDRGREPRCAPDPAYPTGKELDWTVSAGQPSCFVELPYPAKRCGLYIVECKKCGFSLGVTTAGRPDDPKSVRFPCAKKLS